MSKNLATRIVQKHLADMTNASKFISLMFEEVAPLNERKHIDNPHVLSLMLEFSLNPFKKKQQTQQPADDQGDAMASKMLANSDKAKSTLKDLKNTVAMAVKASSAVKSVDLTSVEDVRNKVGALVGAVMKVGALQMKIASDTSLEPEELDSILDPVRGPIDSLYTLAAYNLNAAKDLIDQQIKALEKVVPQSVLRGAAQGKPAPKKAAAPVSKSADPEMDSMRQQIMTPWAKHLGNMAGNALNFGSAGKLREEVAAEE